MLRYTQLIILICCVGCSPPSTPKATLTSDTTAKPTQVSNPKAHWYPLSTAAVSLPAGCSGKCSLDCDLWSGEIHCSQIDTVVSVYGGITSMAGMLLDVKGAHILGTDVLGDALYLRWGTTQDGRFSVDITDNHGNWEFYTSKADEQERSILLMIARSYTREPSEKMSTVCDEPGC